MEREDTGQIVQGEREVNIRELDPNVALRMGVESQRRGAGSVYEGERERNAEFTINT